MRWPWQHKATVRPLFILIGYKDNLVRDCTVSFDPLEVTRARKHYEDVGWLTWQAARYIKVEER